MRADGGGGADGRSPALSAFLEALRAAAVEGAGPPNPARTVIERVTDALSAPGEPGTTPPATLGPCALVEPIVDALATDDRPGASDPGARAAALACARAFAALVPALPWWRRPSEGGPADPFARGHANATLVGPGGLEERGDVWIGASVLAPRVDYPAHRHLPEEAYLVLSPGQWWREGDGWHEPGPGGLVHNRPNVRHAMRSGEAPLLALWCLWRGEGAGATAPSPARPPSA